MSRYALRFDVQYREGLRDIDGFSRGWIVCMNTSRLCLRREDSVSFDSSVSTVDDKQELFLILVKIVSVNPKCGEIVFSAESTYKTVLVSPETLILDFKVYLPYVEAHPETSP